MATYRKKMMEPIINKFQIDPEKNKYFLEIVEMFDEQPNYQEWAVKMFFSKAATMPMIKAVRDFITRFSAQIKNLELQNIVSYNNKGKMERLIREMNGTASIAFLKTEFEKFNTEQKKMLIGRYCPPDIKPYDAGVSSEMKGVVKALQQLEELPSARKKNFWSNCSMLKTPEALIMAIKDAVTGRYSWDKEDFLYFLSHTPQTKDCKVIVDEGDVVVVHVPTWDASKILGGNGRTQWCICTEERFFKQYVTETSPKNDQYFLFDFSKKEYEELAHIGFTIRKGVGICNAFSCTDKDILNGSIQYKGHQYNIGKALSAAKVKLGNFIEVKSAKFQWDIEKFIEYIKANTSSYALSMVKNNVVAVNILTRTALSNLVGHTFIKLDKIVIADNTKAYAMFNFNVDHTDDSSICIAVYGVDAYGTYSPTYSCNMFGTDTVAEEEAKKMGVEVSDFLANEKIDPNVLLHKYIDTKNEDKAIELMDTEKENIDINFKFNGRPPVFSAISNSMFKVYERIVSNPSFNVNEVDGFGETLLEALVFQLGMCEPTPDGDKEREFLARCINQAFEYNQFDFNAVDMNDDTLINISCEDEATLWITKKLVEKPEVDVNRPNFFKMSPLMSAISNKNVEAIKLLMSRDDIKVTKEDIEAATEEGLNVAVLFGKKAEVAR